MALPHPGQSYAGTSALEHGQAFDKLLQERRLGQAQHDQARAGANLHNMQAQYYPLDRELAQRKTAVDERNAGLAELKADRQYQMEMEKHDPSAQFNKFIRLYETSPEGSPQQIFAGQQIQRMISGMGAQGGAHMPAVNGMGGTAQPGVGGMGAQPNANGVTVNPQTVNSKGSLKGTDIATQNKDGTWTTHESATSTAQSNIQQRQIGEAEIAVLWPAVEGGISPYTGAGIDPMLQIGNDILKAGRGDKAAQKRLEDVSLALKLVDETAGAVGRMTYGGTPTEGQQKALIENQLGNLAHYRSAIVRAIPHKYATAALKRYAPLQKKAVEAGVNATREGFAHTTKEKPYFVDMAQQQPSYQLKMVNGKAQLIPTMGAQSQGQPQPGGMGNQQQPPQQMYVDPQTGKQYTAQEYQQIMALANQK